MQGETISGQPTAERVQHSGRGAYRSALHALVLMAGVVLLAGQAAKAQSTVPETFTPPPGCKGFLTVQSRGCTVTNHYRCEADAPGDQWAATFSQDGLSNLIRIDRETQWIENYSGMPPARQTLDPDPADPASFSELLDTGTDTYDFSLTEEGTRTRVKGYDMLTGRTETIDGVEVQETEFDFTETAADGTVLRKSSGNQFIHPEWRLFFSGTENWDFGDGPVKIDGTPRQFIFPGEKGFFSTRPVFDCNVTTSGLGVPYSQDAFHVPS